MNKIWRVSVIVIVIILSSTTQTQACSMCVWAAADKVIPPVRIWCLISMAWFLLNSLIFSLYRVRVSIVPNILIAIVLVFAAILLGGAFLGPLPLLLLGIIPAIVFLRSFPQTNDGKWTKNLYYTVQIIGVIATIVMLGTSYKTYQIYKTRTPAQYIIQWRGTGPSLGTFEQLKRNEPASLTDYRYILEHGDGYILRDVAERVAIIGDLENDSKLIKKAIERIRNTPDSFSVIESLEKSLQDLESRSNKK